MSAQGQFSPMKFLNEGFDHVEYIVRDLSKYAAMFSKMGFEKIGSRDSAELGTVTELYAQGMIRIMISAPNGKKPTGKSHALEFLSMQDEGVTVLAVEVEDAARTFAETTSRGARPASEPRTFETKDGRVTRSEIFTPGNVRYAFISRKAPLQGRALFDMDLVAERLESPTPFHLWRIDHLTNNVDMGEMKKWVKWYSDVFGFVVTRHFDINTGRTGLTSDVVQSEDCKIIVPINEATEPESQVQEFVVRLKGPGVQHLALETRDIISTLPLLKEKAGIKCLTVPSTYYDEVPARVPGVTEDLKVLERLGILLDGEKEGYLLQIFTEEVMGPFFFEFIQRKGNKGFGEGNFKALFQAIERDQIKRGVLKA